MKINCVFERVFLLAWRKTSLLNCSRHLLVFALATSLIFGAATSAFAMRACNFFQSKRYKPHHAKLQPRTSRKRVDGQPVAFIGASAWDPHDHGVTAYSGMVIPQETVIGAFVDVNGGYPTSFTWDCQGVGCGPEYSRIDQFNQFQSVCEFPGDTTITASINYRLFDDSTDYHTTASFSYSCTNQAPIAGFDFGPFKQFNVGTTYDSDGHGGNGLITPGKSYDLDRGDWFALNYTYTLLSKPKSSQASLENANGGQVALTPDVPGDYNVRLVVDDCVNESLPFDFTLTAGGLSAKVTADKTSATQGDHVTFTASVPGGNSGTSYTWNFEQGGSGTIATGSSSATVLAQATGSLQVSVVATTSKGTFRGTSPAVTVTSNLQGPPATLKGGGPGNNNEGDCHCIKQDPVNVNTGALWESTTDFSVPGRTPETNLAFVRNYTALSATGPGDLGPNWHHNFESKLVVSRSAIVWVDPKAGPWVFSQQRGSITPPPALNASLQLLSDHYELRQADHTVLSYSLAGNLLSIKDRHGEITSLNYDGSGKLTSVTAPMAGAINFTRDSLGRIITVTRARDNLTYSYTYDSNGNLATATDFSGHTYSYTYVSGQLNTKAHGLLASITDPLGRLTRNVYDDQGRAVQQFGPEGSVSTFTYGDHQTLVREPDGSVSTYIFDDDQWLTQKVLPDGTNEYYSRTNGLVTRMQRDNGGTTFYGYDTNLNLNSVQRPGDQAPSKTTYDLVFNVPTVISPLVGAATTNKLDPQTGDVIQTSRNGLSLQYTRDAFGNLLSVNNGQTTYADQRDSNGLLTTKFDLHNPESRTYDARFRLASRNFASGRTLTYGYDDYDRILTIVDSAGPSTTNQYDAMGRLTQKTVSAGGVNQVTKIQYDDRDRVVAQTDPMNRTTTYQYDQVHVIDKPSSVTDPAGRTTYFVYDKLQRLISKTDALGAVTSYTYDQRGNMTSVTDANGNVTRYAFDLNSRKIREDRPSVAGSVAARRVTLYFYDAADHLVREVTKSATNGADRAIYYQYDSLDRLVRKIAQRESSAGNVVDDDSSFTYANELDATLMTSAVNGVASLSFSYESAPPFALTGYSVAATQSGNPFGLITGNFTVARDVTGEIAGVAKDGTTLLSKSYDPAGRLTGVTGAGGSTTLSYDGFGRKATVAHSDGSSASIQYDLLNRITAQAWVGQTPISEALGWDAAGNITSLQREGSSASALAYDAVDQLLSSSGGSTEVRNYTLDPLGNRLADSLDGPGNFINNFLTSNGVATYAADPDGFGDVIREVKSGITKNYLYRADDRISGFQGGNTQVAYYYDGLGRITAKAISDTSGSYTQSFAHLGTETRPLMAKAGDGTITTYMDGKGLNEHLSESRNGVFKGYVTDHLGSILNSDAAGSNHRYALFGGPTGAALLSSSSDPASFAFAGGMLDRASENTKLGHRELNHDTGRWQSMDPIGYKSKDSNYYRYAMGNSLRFTDPTGLASFQCNPSPLGGSLGRIPGRPLGTIIAASDDNSGDDYDPSIDDPIINPEPPTKSNCEENIRSYNKCRAKNQGDTEEDFMYHCGTRPDPC